MEERIKENEPLPAGEGAATGQAEAAVIQPPAGRKKHKVRDLIKDMWPAYLIEIFVIILGISITLALEEWRDSAKEKRLEQIYLKNLQADIGLDMHLLKYTLGSTQNLLDRGNDLIAYIKNPARKAISSSQILTDIHALLERPKFIAHEATFSDLKSSGNLHLLEDIQLKKLLFAYYSQTQNIKENQDAEQQATITIAGSYFLKQFPFGDFESQQAGIGPNVFKDLPKNIEFGNNVLLRVANREELLYLYQKADSLATQLDHALLAKTGAGE